MSDTKRAAVAQTLQVPKNIATSARIKTGKLAQKLGFPGVARSPQRRELAALQAKVAVWQPDPAAAALARQLEQAIEAIYRPGDRKQQVDAAEATARAVRDGLDQLAAAAAQANKARKAALPGKGDIKDLKLAKNELTAQLDRVMEGVGKLAGPVRLPKASANLEPFALQAKAASIRAAIGAMGAENVTAVIQDLINQIEDLRDLVVRGNKETADGVAYLKGEAQTSLDEFDETLTRFDKEAGDRYEGPLRRILEVLHREMTAVPGRPEVVRALIKQADDEVEIADFGVVAMFDAALGGSPENKANGEAMLARLESMLSPWHSDLVFLIDNNVPNVTHVLMDIDTLRADAGKPIDNRTMAQATLDLRASVDAVHVYAQSLLATAKATIASDALNVQSLLATTRQSFGTEHQAHGDEKAVQADFATVDAQLGSAAEIVPVSGAIPASLTAADVQLARSLVLEAKATLDGIAANKDKLDGFDDTAKAAGKSLDQRGFLGRQVDKLTILAPFRDGAKGLLAQYDPDATKDFQKRYDALIKGLPQTPSADSVAALDKLGADVAAATATLQAAVDYLTKTALPKLAALDKEVKGYKGQDGVDVADKPSAAMDRLYKERSFGLDSQYRPVPKAYTTALEALRTATTEQPPIVATLQAAVAAADVQQAAVQAMAMPDRVAAAYTDRDADQKQAEDDAKQQSAELKLLLPLERTYAAARAAVAEVKGDRNALDAAGRLLEQVKEDIAAKAFTALPGKRKDLQQRLKLLIGNPRGEMNSRRSELPAVIAELKAAVSAADEAFRTVRDQLKMHTPANPTEAGALISARHLLGSYRKLLPGRVEAMEKAAAPINDTKVKDEDARRAAREAGLRLMRAFRDQLRAHPLTPELLVSPFPEAKAALAPVFRALDKYEYTLITCI